MKVCVFMGRLELPLTVPQSAGSRHLPGRSAGSALISWTVQSERNSVIAALSLCAGSAQDPGQVETNSPPQSSHLSYKLHKQGLCVRFSREDSGQLQGHVRDNFRKTSGTCQEQFRKTSGTCQEQFQDNFRDMSGTIQEQFRNISGKQGHVRNNFRNIPEKSQEHVRKYFRNNFRKYFRNI
ncbi:Hypothetical predicted protein [Xyrichtys novacula]|uniref:Uncharacterized protein n=1 Tax=Xyrichtys novacula TaxID=13765 RepID=A0AAV1EI08_XYRNO|nr:Hypothetical predicted protein [Xyrichtys novacula]